MIKDLKEDLNKSIDEIYENINKSWNEMEKTDYNMKVEMELLMKIQTKGNLEMKNMELLQEPQKQALLIEYKR